MLQCIMIITTNTIDIAEQLVLLIGRFNSRCDRAVCLSTRLSQNHSRITHKQVTSVLCADLYFNRVSWLQNKYLAVMRCSG